MRRIHFCFVAWLFVLAAFACAGGETPSEPPFERGADLIRLELRAAHTGLCALSVAAHPDDEDGATLAWLRRLGGVEVHLCLATRGEGGQNESGPELGAELALKRTRETESAARILGAKVWYLNLPEFGYSKSPEETLKVWNHDEALGRLVRVLRIVQPDIVLTNHNPEGTDHGHHVATAKLVFEAYEAAADPKRYPEQLEREGLAAWAVSKLYRRVWASPGATLTFEVSRRDPSSGYAPSDLAAWALARHVSQGMSREVRAGEPERRNFVLERSRVEPRPAAERSMLKGLAADEVANTSADLRAVLSELRNEQAAPAPAEVQAAARHRRRLRHLEVAAAETLGLRLEGRAEDPLAAPGQEVGVTLRLANTGVLPVTLTRWSLIREPGWEGAEPAAAPDPIPAGGHVEAALHVRPTDTAFPNYPPEQYLDSRIESRAPVQASATIRVEADGQVVEFALPAVPLPVALAPAFEARFADEPVLIFDDPDRDDKDLVLCRARLLVTNHRREPWTLYAKLAVDERVKASSAAEAVLSFTEEEQTLSAEFRLMAPVSLLDSGDLVLPAVLWTPETRFAHPPEARFRRVRLKLPAPLNVGLVQTYDEATWKALNVLAAQQPGLSVLRLTPDDLRENDLHPLHTLILDLRATQYRPDVLANRRRLREYMEYGGNVVCLYHKDFDWNETGEEARGRGIFRGKGGGGAIAPFPITLSFDRVTDESAPVRLLDPNHPLLSRPCRIWERDFAGWVQERGVYFPKSWDERYVPLLSANDPGAKPLDGGLLVAGVGKGSFIYTSFVWYRQLRAGVPGAYRMLANLIAYPRVKAEKP